MSQLPTDIFEKKYPRVVHVFPDRILHLVTSTYHLQGKCASAQVACPEGFNDQWKLIINKVFQDSCDKGMRRKEAQKIHEAKGKQPGELRITGQLDYGTIE